MPVIHVRVLSPSDESVRALMQALPLAVAHATGIRTERIWATFTPLRPGASSVAGRLVESPADGPIAYVDAHVQPRTPFVVEALIEAAARCVAEHLELPVEDVWARAWPIEPGTVFAGGDIQR